MPAPPNPYVTDGRFVERCPAGTRAEPSVKVVAFQPAHPDFFIAHLDVAKAAERPEVLGLWREFVLRLTAAYVVNIAKIRGRTRGIGNEFVLACRFASRQSALFSQPEAGVALDSFVDTLVRRLASFDRETLGAAKAQVNRFGMPATAELQSSNDRIFPLPALPDAQASQAVVSAMVIQATSN